MINTIGKILVYIILIPFLWIYFGFKMLKNKEQRNRNNILISIISFIIFAVMITGSDSPTTQNDKNSNINVADNKTVAVESADSETDVVEILTVETTATETTIAETTTVATSTTTETTTPKATIIETTVQETTILAAAITEAAVPETTVAAAAITEAAVPETTVLETVAPEVTEQLVWITATGSKYHSINNCGNTNPNNAYQMSLSDAQAAGYEPCKRCYR
ncbi:MAG: hypothetical protein HDT39_16935 [Lachnospiraceae bacterium]|nr:hypothetical protein [Lachnospiraceae bacterium]